MLNIFQIYIEYPNILRPIISILFSSKNKITNTIPPHNSRQLIISNSYSIDKISKLVRPIFITYVIYFISIYYIQKKNSSLVLRSNSTGYQSLRVLSRFAKQLVFISSESTKEVIDRGIIKLFATLHARSRVILIPDRGS